MSSLHKSISSLSLSTIIDNIGDKNDNTNNAINTTSINAILLNDILPNNQKNDLNLSSQNHYLGDEIQNNANNNYYLLNFDKLSNISNRILDFTENTNESNKAVNDNIYDKVKFAPKTKKNRKKVITKNSKKNLNNSNSCIKFKMNNSIEKTIFTCFKKNVPENFKKKLVSKSCNFETKVKLYNSCIDYNCFKNIKIEKITENNSNKTDSTESNTKTNNNIVINNNNFIANSCRIINNKLNEKFLEKSDSSNNNVNKNKCKYLDSCNSNNIKDIKNKNGELSSKKKIKLIESSSTKRNVVKHIEDTNIIENKNINSDDYNNSDNRSNKNNNFKTKILKNSSDDNKLLQDKKELEYNLSNDYNLINDKSNVNETLLCWKNDYHYIRQLLNKAQSTSGLLSFSLHQTIKLLYYQICTNQQTSRILQSLLSKTEIYIIEDIYTCIKPKIKYLLTNVYSNYLCQKLYSRLKLSNDQVSKINFLELVLNNFRIISCNKTGTFCLQKIIDIISSDEEKKTLLKKLDETSKEDISIVCCVSNINSIFILKLIL